MFIGQGPTKATQASTAETIRFNESDLPGGTQVRAFYHAMTGTAQDFDSLTTIIVKAGGREVYSVTELELAAFDGYWGKKAGPGAAATRFTIPFYYGGLPGMSLGFAPRAAAIEIGTDGTASAAGTISVAYAVEPNVPTTHYPMLVGSAANIAASATNGRFPVTQPGIMRGLILSRTTSITSIRIYARNQPILDLSGALFLEYTNQPSGTTVTLNQYVEVPPFPIIPGETFVELTTDGSWVATDRVVVHSLVPVTE